MGKRLMNDLADFLCLYNLQPGKSGMAFGLPTMSMISKENGCRLNKLGELNIRRDDAPPQ